MARTPIMRGMRRPWKHVGLLLILLLLGHDLLMATVSHAAPADRSTVEHHAGAPHRSAEHDAASQGNIPQPEHPMACGAGQTVARRAADELDPFDRVVGTKTSISDSAGVLLWPTAVTEWRAPHWPPATMRSLLQVYRI